MGTSGADRVIAFPQCGQQIAHCLKRTHHVFTCARQKHQSASDDDEAKSPVDFGAKIAEPEKGEGNDRCWCSGGYGEPGQSPFMRKAASRTRAQWLMASCGFRICRAGHGFLSISDRQLENQRSSKAIMLKTPIKRASAQA